MNCDVAHKLVSSYQLLVPSKGRFRWPVIKNIWPEEAIWCRKHRDHTTRCDTHSNSHCKWWVFRKSWGHRILISASITTNKFCQSRNSCLKYVIFSVNCYCIFYIFLLVCYVFTTIFFVNKYMSFRLIAWFINNVYISFPVVKVYFPYLVANPAKTDYHFLFNSAIHRNTTELPVENNGKLNIHREIIYAIAYLN